MILTEENFKLACAKYYDSIDIYSFNEDIARIHMVRKLIRKFISTGDINEKLVLNHIIILYNGFGEFTLNILYFIFTKEEYKYINSFLIFLNRLPDDRFVYGIDITLSKKLEQI
jgi:hypothetical protein